jgi:hypothetical protein
MPTNAILWLESSCLCIDALHFCPLLVSINAPNTPPVCHSRNVDSLAQTELDFDVQLDFSIPAGYRCLSHVMVPRNRTPATGDDDVNQKRNVAFQCRIKATTEHG